MPVCRFIPCWRQRFFRPGWPAAWFFLIYLVGIVLAVVIAKLLRVTVLAGPSEPFVMELPEYRLPIPKNVLIQVGERAWLYLKKAGTVILAASILLWGLFTFPVHQDTAGSPMVPAHLADSFAGSAGRGLEPLLKPLGLDWRSAVALLSGITAKEVVVSTMSTLYSLQGDQTPAAAGTGNLADRVRAESGLTPLTAFVFMIFSLIYIPCMSTLAVVHRETNSWQWPLFMASYTLILAWLVSFLVYRGGLWWGLG